MKWQIPAKTFLLGEYAALLGGSAIVLTTSPCFEMTLVDGNELTGIHADSPAGRWWARHSDKSHGLRWHDPYQQQGGVGASSAQFLGAWLASCYLMNQTADPDALLKAYFQNSWNGSGLRPSGYDVLAQSQKGCVYINRQTKTMECCDWPFNDISFLLLRSGQKLTTHHHLQSTTLPDSIHKLSTIVDEARQAFDNKDSEQLIHTIKTWQIRLENLNLITSHSLLQLDRLTSLPNVLAAKGCGALGADILLVVVPGNNLIEHEKQFTAQGWNVLAASNNLYLGHELIKNNHKKLEILS